MLDKNGIYDMILFKYPGRTGHTKKEIANMIFDISWVQCSCEIVLILTCFLTARIVQVERKATSVQIKSLKRTYTKEHLGDGLLHPETSLVATTVRLVSLRFAKVHSLNNRKLAKRWIVQGSIF